MTNKDNLPAKSLIHDLAQLTGQSSSLVARGLTAVLQLKAEQFLITTEHDPEILFKKGLSHRYREDGTTTDDDKARKYFQAAADLDHAGAQFELGCLLLELSESEEAEMWIERSADQGYGPSLRYYVMNADLDEEEEYEDYFQKARAWYESRVSDGPADLQFDFAELLLWHQYDRDIKKEAMRWLNASAEGGCRRACSRLAYEYLRAKVSNESTEKAIHWLSRAAELGDSWAFTDLALLYFHGHLDKNADKEKRPPNLRIKPDPSLAISWLERGASTGNRRVAYHLGYYYLKGDVVEQNLPLAEKWLLQAANEGFTSAQTTLGNEYASGVRFRQNSHAAIHWLEIAVENSIFTGLTLAEIYLEGKIVPRIYSEAFRWLDRSSAEGTFRNKAMKMVAEKCFDGRFTSEQESAARSWMTRMANLAIDSVADMDQPQSESKALRLGELYEQGLGVEKDMEKAVYWYKQSAKLGLWGAEKRLKELNIELDAE